MGVFAQSTVTGLGKLGIGVIAARGEQADQERGEEQSFHGGKKSLQA
jgi:hypothetical protein